MAGCVWFIRATDRYQASWKRSVELFSRPVAITTKVTGDVLEALLARIGKFHRELAANLRRKTKYGFRPVRRYAPTARRTLRRRRRYHVVRQLCRQYESEGDSLTRSSDSKRSGQKSATILTSGGPSTSTSIRSRPTKLQSSGCFASSTGMRAIWRRYRACCHPRRAPAARP
jgi:hypothetical protein